MRAYLSRTSAPTPVLIRAANGFQIILGKVRPITSPGREPSTSSDHCSCRLAFDLWCQGYPEQARTAQHEGLARAQALAHPFSLAYALVWGGMLDGEIGNFESV